jgi:hypothetical protein
MNSYSIKSVVKLLNKHNPQNITDVLACGFGVTQVAEGSYRNAYQIANLPIILKIPIVPKDINHSRTEYQSIQRILKSTVKFKVLHKYMPTIYYYSNKTGMILMKMYKKLGYEEGRVRRETLDTLVAELLSVDEPDVDNSGNVAVDGKGSLKIIDLGCFKRSGRF